MSIATVTPVEIAAYISEKDRKKKEYEKKNRAAKKGKESLFGTAVAIYSASEDTGVNKYVTYGKNRKYNV